MFFVRNIIKYKLTVLLDRVFVKVYLLSAGVSKLGSYYKRRKKAVFFETNTPTWIKEKKNKGNFTVS